MDNIADLTQMAPSLLARQNFLLEPTRGGASTPDWGWRELTPVVLNPVDVLGASVSLLAFSQG